MDTIIDDLQDVRPDVRPDVTTYVPDIVTEDIDYKIYQSNILHNKNIEKIIVEYESSYESSESFDSFNSFDSVDNIENTTNNAREIIKEDEAFYGSTRHNRISCAYIVTVLTLLLVVINIIIYYFKG